MTENNVPATRTASAPAKPNKIESYLRSEAFLGEARKLLGSKDLAERLARCAITCIYTANQEQRQKLLAADPASLVQVVLSLAEVDLEPGRDAYLIPRGGQITASIRWEGYVRAARMSGQIRRVWSDVIREGDEYRISAGSTGNSIDHSWKLGASRGEIIGAYACAEWMDGTVETIVKDRDYFDRCKAVSQSPKTWNLWPDQMIMAKVVKLLCKRLPLGRPEKTFTASVLEGLDADAVENDPPAIEDTTPRARGVAGLKAKLELPAGDEGEPEEPAAKPARARRVKPPANPANVIREALADSGAPLTEDDLVTYLIMHQHQVGSLDEASDEALADLAGKLKTTAGATYIRDVLDHGVPAAKG